LFHNAPQMPKVKQASSRLFVALYNHLATLHAIKQVLLQ